MASSQYLKFTVGKIRGKKLNLKKDFCHETLRCDIKMLL